MTFLTEHLVGVVEIKIKRELDNMLTYLPNYYLDYIRLLKRIKRKQ